MIILKINVSEILKATGNEEHIQTSEEVLYPDQGLNIVAPIDIDVRLLNSGETILLTGTVKTKIRLTCCRCLKDFDLPVTLDLEEEYGSKLSPKKKRSAKSKKEIELKEEDFIFQIGSDNTIDLSEAIRQNLLTTLPIKPLCKPDCSGIRR